MCNSLWLSCLNFPSQKGLQAHLDGHLDVHPDVRLDVQFIMVVVLGLSLIWRSRLKLSIEIENFKRDWKVQARLNFSNLWVLRYPRKRPRRLRLFLCKTHQRVPRKTATRVLTGKFPVLTKLNTKVFSVNFHMSCSIQNDYRQTCFSEGNEFQLQIQNRAARAVNCHYRDRSVEILAEYLSLQIHILPAIPINFHYRYIRQPRNTLVL